MYDTGVFILGCAATATGLALGAVLYGEHPFRKFGSLLVVSALPALAWAVPPERPATRAFLAVFTALGLFKWVQTAVDDDRGAWRYRVWQWTAPFDVRDATPKAPQIEWRLVLRTTAGFLLFTGALLYIRSPLGGALEIHAQMVAYFVGVLAVVSLGDAVTNLVRCLHGPAGFAVAPIMDDTWWPQSMQDFWGRRWNRTVSRWLLRYVFNAWAYRRRIRVGLACAFLTSALIHFYVTWVPLGPKWGAVVAAFFLVQFPLIVFERRWIAPPYRRAFAIAALLLTAPAFVLPFNRILRGGESEACGDAPSSPHPSPLGAFTPGYFNPALAFETGQKSKP
ncbi:MAG: MBOAT family protein [Myxococcota bacterium]